MATLMIRKVDERVKAGLRVLAARRGVSTEQHARDILEQAVLGATRDEPFAQRIRQRFAAVAVESLPLPVRLIPRMGTASTRTAKRRLLDHLATVKLISSCDWTRDELYDR